MKKIKIMLLTSLFLSLILPSLSIAESAMSHFSRLQQAGLLVTNAQGKTLKSKRAHRSFVPASTVKIATAWLALQRWGEDYRFRTDFFFDHRDNTLSVKGSGDPYLVSEELTMIAQQLAQRGIRQVNRIALDNALFEDGLVLSGTGNSNNPYDAVPSALAANFNTVNIKKRGGKVISAEPQTPLTPFARSMKKRFKKGTLRVNTGRDPHNAERYFGELLAAFLRREGIQVRNLIVANRAPQQQPIYQHHNSRTLAEVIRPMLKYSTNFIANQLALTLAADTYKQPANARLVKRYMNSTLKQHFHWKNFNLQEGAGLSRKNRLTPKQLVDLLHRFTRWKHLLPKKETGVYAKSGTLRGVSTLAGYLVRGNEWKPFALMINQSVPHKLRNRIAKQLRQTF
ncbi:MAG: D-alanyl-D-alanine carboxypeptidase [Cocleimonas sp.]|nr:D-alanyl-D-alanine carboxypeptidase [Cocleimonas sp.]